MCCKRAMQGDGQGAKKMQACMLRRAAAAGDWAATTACSAFLPLSLSLRFTLQSKCTYQNRV